MKQNFTVRQGALDGVEAFLSVAQHRSFRRAAAELGVTPSAISQAVRALEARVGAALFIRTTRSVGLTEAGERFLSRAKPAFEELVAASEVARDLGQRPAGLLRLSVPRAVVPILLEPLIASFCQAYPEVEVEIAASAELVDLAAEGFDAGIRLGQFIAADMVAVRLTPPFPFVVVGSPDYLRRRSGRNASTICVSTPACACAAQTDRSRPGPLSTATRQSRRSSPGRWSRTTTPRSSERRSKVWDLRRCPVRSPERPIAEGRLQALLTPFAVTTPGVFLYYPERRQVLPKLRAFIDHVKYQSADVRRNGTTARRLRELDGATARDDEAARRIAIVAPTRRSGGAVLAVPR